MMMADSKLLCYSHYLQSQLREAQKLSEKCSDFLYILMKILCSEQYKAWEEYRDIISHYSVSVSAGMRAGASHPMVGLGRSGGGGASQSSHTQTQAQAQGEGRAHSQQLADGDGFAQDEAAALLKIPTAHPRVIAMHGCVYYTTARDYKRCVSAGGADPGAPQWVLVRAVLTYDSNLYLYRLTDGEQEALWQAASAQDPSGAQGRRQLSPLPGPSSRWCGDRPLAVLPTEYAAVNILNYAGEWVGEMGVLCDCHAYFAI